MFDYFLVISTRKRLILLIIYLFNCLTNYSKSFLFNISMSEDTFFCNTLAYIWVVLTLECPSILDTVIKGTSLFKVMVVAKLWRAIWKVRFLKIWAFIASFFNCRFKNALLIYSKIKPSFVSVLFFRILRDGFNNGTIKVSPVFFRLLKIYFDPFSSLWIWCHFKAIISA